MGGKAMTVAAAINAPQFVTPSPMKLKDATMAVFELMPESASANKK
jgi:hypothetical protein